MGMTRSGGFGNINAQPDSNKSKRDSEIVDLLELSADFQQLRLVGPVQGVANHWIDIETKKGVISIPKPSLRYDPKTDTFDDTLEDPYEEIDNPRRTSKSYYVNAIVRDLQDNEPKKKPALDKTEKKKGLKTKGSSAWTPVRVLRVPATVAGKLQKLRQVNKHKIDGKLTPCDITDPKYGCDIFMSFDNDLSGSDKYQVQIAEKTKLSKEEKEYLIYDLTGLHNPEDLKTARKEAEALAAKMPGDENMDEGDEDEEDDMDRKRKSKKKSSKSGKSSKSKVKTKKKRSRDEDEDDDDEDKPRSKRSKSASKGKTVKKRKVKRI